MVKSPRQPRSDMRRDVAATGPNADLPAVAPPPQRPPIIRPETDDPSLLSDLESTQETEAPTEPQAMIDTVKFVPNRSVAQTQPVNTTEIVDAESEPAPKPPAPKPQDTPNEPTGKPTPPSSTRKDSIAAELKRRFLGDGTSPEAPVHAVQVIDSPQLRVHHPSDFAGIVISAIGMVIVLFLGAYAHGTTAGVTEDVQTATHVFLRVLTTPIEWFIAFTLLVLPVAVLIELAIRRAMRQVIEALIAAVAGFLLGLMAQALLSEFGPEELTTSFMIGEQVSLSPLTIAVVGLLSVAGRHGARPIITWTWNAIWIALGLSVLTNGITLPAALLAALIGRAAGLTVRYVAGVASERAYGGDLVRAMTRAGINPKRVVRVRDVSQIGLAADGAQSDSAAVALGRVGDNRVYAVTTRDGRRVDVVVFDRDRQIIGYVERAWRTLRLRALERRSVTSVRQLAERTALIGYTAAAAGVRTPAVLGIAEANESMIIAQEHPEGAASLRDLPPVAITDEVLAKIWAQLRQAHAVGLAHRGISQDSVLLDADRNVWLTSWENGDVASSELARRLDLAQALVMMALIASPQRAVESARSVMTIDELAAIGPALQPIILPSESREDARGQKNVLEALRKAVIAEVPEGHTQQPETFTRFSWWSVIMTVGLIIAAYLVITTLNFGEVADAFQEANLWWLLVAFAILWCTYAGAAMSLMGYSPVKLKFHISLINEIAAAFAGFIAPAGVGPATLNLRYLTRRGMSVALAAATVGLMQMSALVTSVVLLVILVVSSGSMHTVTNSIPSTAIFIIIGVVVAIVGGTMAVPVIRSWVLAKITPTLHEIWPRLVEVLGQPRKLAMGIGGSVVVNVGYLLGFWAAVRAFGYDPSLLQIAIIYLFGNAAGALIPSPGGLGTIEATLTAGLMTAGIPPAVAASIVIIFRLLSYWIRVPLGWVALQYLQRKKIV